MSRTPLWESPSCCCPGGRFPSLRIRELGGRVRNQTRGNLSRMIPTDTMVSSHDFLSSLIDQASTRVFYISGPVLGNSGRGAQQRPKLTWSFYLGSLHSNREERYWRVRNENRGPGEWGVWWAEKEKNIKNMRDHFPLLLPSSAFISSLGWKEMRDRNK